MADRPVRIITKQTSTPGRIPTGTTNYEDNFIRQGEMAQNTADKKLFGFDGVNIFEYGVNSFYPLTGGTISGNTIVTTISATTSINGINLKRSHEIYTMGDSLTAAGTYQSQLISLLGATWNTVNYGTPGDTTAQMLARSPSLNAGDAEYIIVWGGVNDLIGGIPAVTIEANLQTMYSNAKATGAKVIALTTTPFSGNAGWTSGIQLVQNALNGWILTAATDVDYVLNIYTLLADPSSPNRLLPAFNSGDSLHLNTLGYSTIGNHIFSSITFTASTTIPTLSLAKDISLSQNLTPLNAPTFSGMTLVGNLFLGDNSIFSGPITSTGGITGTTGIFSSNVTVSGIVTTLNTFFIGSGTSLNAYGSIGAGGGGLKILPGASTPDLILATNSANNGRLKIVNSTNSVLIGDVSAIVDDSVSALQVFGSATTQVLTLKHTAPSINLNTSTSTNSIIRFNNTSGTTTYASISANAASGEIQYFARSGGYFPTWYANGAETARIIANGNFGINTTIPREKLEVNGNLLVNNISGTTVTATTVSVQTLTARGTTGAIANNGIVVRDLVGTTTHSAIYMGKVPDAVNYSFGADNVGNTFINAPTASAISFFIGGAVGTTMGTISEARWALQTGAVTGGSLNAWRFLVANNSQLVANVDAPSIQWTLPTQKQYLSGATQFIFREFNITQPIIRFSGGTNTATTIGTLVIGGPPGAGTNARFINSAGLLIENANVAPTGTVDNAFGLLAISPSGATNNFAAGFSGNTKHLAGTAQVTIGNLVGSTTQTAIYMGLNSIAPTATNYILRADASTNSFVNGSQVFLATGGSTRITLNDDKILFSNFTAVAAGASTSFLWIKPNNTNQTASTEIPGWKYAGGTRTWAGGIVPLQRENWWTATTYQGATATTVNVAFGNFFEQPIQSSNMTILENWAAGFGGSIQVLGGFSGGSITSTTLSDTGTTRMVEASSGGTLTATKQVISAFGIPASAQTQLSLTTNWDIDGNYTGTTLSNVYQGQMYYDGNYFFMAVVDNTCVRLIRG